MTDTAKTGESACPLAWLLVLGVIGITLIKGVPTGFCAPEMKPVSEVLGTTALQLMRQPFKRAL